MIHIIGMVASLLGEKLMNAQKPPASSSFLIGTLFGGVGEGDVTYKDSRASTGK